MVPILALVSAAFVAVNRLVETVAARFGRDSGGAAPWMAFFGVAIDLLSDGFLIRTGSVVSLGPALLLAPGQVSADLPEGFAVMANFKTRGVPRPNTSW